MTKYVRKDPELSRRKFINVALGTTAGVGTLSLLSIIGGVKPPYKITPEKELPRPGDVLVHADGPNAGQPVQLADIQPERALFAYPKGKASNGKEVLKNGVDRNQLIVAKFQPSELKAPTDVKATDQGVIVYSRQCMHLGCAVLIQPYTPANLKVAAVCPCHGGAYNLTAGAQVVGGPPPAPLAQLPIKVQGDQLVVDGFFLSLPYDISEPEFVSQKEELTKA
ncbi:Rieske 2Fe-2S domain-containing protein [Deinococcus sonorensis]|uniref:Rieske 2Fe-2S domain-containing protein n=2 Tax=Deinococcus sonorensis TaxID=309891 RepID=A0AAU7UDD0_9DEIO